MRRRIALACVGLALVVVGLAVARGMDGPVAAFVGDALYAALIVVVIAFLAPRASAVTVAVAAFAVCAAVELFQLTGVPAALADSVPAVALVLGTTFQWTDLVAYAIGAMLTGAVDAVSRRAAGSSRGGSTTPSAGARPPHPPAGTPSR
ncbi:MULTISPECIES: ribosomal maturation YjgA family protein [unclassified Leifsonia]|uniref:ribosomal maturation YjgA family protein n=1 Tax=unclassified Leifsonia TaxID=2663824 RepID=UPI000B7E55DF|nr:MULTISPECIES: DUF2809 domain-containing protein [unclassified Leifsonia]